MKTADLIYLIFTLAILVFAGVYLYFWLHKPTHETPKQTSNSSLLTLQAYERLVILCERLAFSSLFQRLKAGQLSAKQLAEVYIETIHTEFEHNASQQIYVSEKTWKTMLDLRDQQVFIIRQILGALPKKASGVELEKAIQELLRIDHNASIQPIVLELVKNEAKKQLKHM